MEKNVFGIVKSFDCERGCGFIKRADAGEDVIVHTSGIEDGQSLKKGTKVVFDIGHKAKVVLDVRFKPRGGQRLSVASHVKQLETVSGRVKSFDAERGCGFIVRDDTNEDLFVHKSSIAMSGPLNAGDQVEFNVVLGQKGPEASNVTQKLETTEDRGNAIWQKMFREGSNVLMPSVDLAS